MFYFGVIYCLIYLNIQTISAFNFVPKHAEIFSNNNSNSYFGYSLLLQAPSVTTSPRLIVGAPKDNQTNQFDKKQSGSLYVCSLKNNECSKFLLYLSDNSDDKRNFERNNSWLGSTLDGSDSAGGVIVTCAPRLLNNINKNVLLQNGICYVLKESTNTEKIATLLQPLRDNYKLVFNGPDKLPRYYYALAEAGMSVHLTKPDNNDLLIGAPGLLDWKGMIVRYHKDTKTFIPNPAYISAIEDFSYFGYAVSSGKFYSMNNKTLYVGGAPRGRSLFGQVLIYDYIEDRDDLFIYEDLIGRQPGEYFGASLSVGDINGDGYDDIVVGSPMYSLQYKFDIGCVYVYINTNKRTFTKSILYGSKEQGARFGSAVSVVGDANNDGYADVFIGEPYAEHSGVIYLYLGTKMGLKDTYSQRITGSEISPLLKGFGSSFSRGQDIDKNSYIDVAVGAYSSGHAVLIKTRPVAQVLVTLSSEKMQLTVDTNQTKVSVCMQYFGKNLPSTLILKVSVNFDSIYKRAYLTNNKDNFISLKLYTLKRNQTICDHFDLHILNKVELTEPILVEEFHELMDDSDTFCAICPLLDNSVPNKTVLSIPFEKGCGSDEICQTDLVLNATFDNNQPYLVIGLVNKININIEISNKGEIAYGTKLYVEIPPTTGYLSLPNMCQSLQNNLLFCEIQKPITKTDKKINITIPIDISMLETADKLIVYLNVTNSGHEQNMLDNVVVLEKLLNTNVTISVTGISDPEQILFTENNNNINEKHYQFWHNYTVQNMGPSPLDNLELNFYIPLRFKVEQQNIIQVFKPENNEVYCTTFGSDEFYSPETTTQTVLLEVEDPLEIGEYRKKRSDKMNNRNNFIRNNNNNICNNEDCMQFICLPHNNVTCLQVLCTMKIKLYRYDKFNVQFKLLANLFLLDSETDDKDIVVFSSIVEPISKYYTAKYVVTDTIFQVYESQEVPLRWIVLGCILGIIMLTALIYALYKVGFFQRHNHEELINEKEEKLSEEGTSDICDR